MTNITFMLGFDDHDSYYSLNQEQIPQIIDLSLQDMFEFVVDNGEPVSCSSDQDADVYLPEDTDYVSEQEEHELRDTLAQYAS